MKFSDKIERGALDEIYVLRTEKEMEAREEVNSHLWDLQRENFCKPGSNLYKTVVRDCKISENVYNKAGRLVCYRVE